MRDDPAAAQPRGRIVGVSRGDPYDPGAASGLPRHLFDALDRRYGLAGRVDVQLTPMQRRLVAPLVFHPNRDRWRERFYKNALSYELQSRNSRRGLVARGNSGVLAFQVHALFQTRGAPYVVEIDTTHELSRASWPPWSPFTERSVERWFALERRTYRAAEHLFARTQLVATSLETFYGVESERVTVTGGGANVDALPALPRREGAPVVLFVGREYRRKGGDVLLQAFRHVREAIPSARLVFVGTDEPDAADGVEVLGEVRDRAQLVELYARATVFSLPSVFEPYGLALLEAMAHGLPVVATTSGGIPEIVEDGRTGLLVAPGDANGLAAALLALLRDPDRATAFGAAGRRRVEQELNWDAVVERMAPALDALLERLRPEDPRSTLRA